MEEATYQFLLHVQNLMDRETGLWFHGWNYEGGITLPGRVGRGQQLAHHGDPGFSGTGGSPEERGTALSDYSPRRTDCRLGKMPDDSGLWHTLLDDPHSYLEASATAGFAYGILKAVRKRYVGQHYAGVAEKRFAELCRIFRRRGAAADLIWHRDGVRPRLYRQIPLTSMPYGQAMAILV